MNVRQVDAWLRLAADRLHQETSALTRLDQAIGDGDHGINMDRGFRAIVAMLDAQTTEPAVGGVLRQAGQTLIRTVGGASGPLYGTAFLRAASVYARLENPSLADAVEAMKAATEGIGSLGKSTTGEKTMLDALFPAVIAARTALEAGHDGPAVFAAAREAAAAGAEATIPMLATKGRASYLGERSIGHQDPGATSAALLIGALADVIARG